MNMETDNPALKRYRRMAWVTIAAVYFLILVGATVRASGSGMGCPDWPTCFVVGFHRRAKHSCQ